MSSEVSWLKKLLDSYKHLPENTFVSQVLVAEAETLSASSYSANFSTNQRYVDKSNSNNHLGCSGSRCCLHNEYMDSRRSNNDTINTLNKTSSADEPKPFLDSLSSNRNSNSTVATITVIELPAEETRSVKAIENPLGNCLSHGPMEQYHKPLVKSATNQEFTPTGYNSIFSTATARSNVKTLPHDNTDSLGRDNVTMSSKKSGLGTSSLANVTNIFINEPLTENLSVSSSMTKSLLEHPQNCKPTIILPKSENNNEKQEIYRATSQINKMKQESIPQNYISDKKTQVLPTSSSNRQESQLSYPQKNLTHQQNLPKFSSPFVARKWNLAGPPNSSRWEASGKLTKNEGNSLPAENRAKEDKGDMFESPWLTKPFANPKVNQNNPKNTNNQSDDEEIRSLRYVSRNPKTSTTTNKINITSPTGLRNDELHTLVSVTSTVQSGEANASIVLDAEENSPSSASSTAETDEDESDHNSIDTNFFFLY